MNWTLAAIITAVYGVVTIALWRRYAPKEKPTRSSYKPGLTVPVELRSNPKVRWELIHDPEQGYGVSVDGSVPVYLGRTPEGAQRLADDLIDLKDNAIGKR